MRQERAQEVHAMYIGIRFVLKDARLHALLRLTLVRCPHKGPAPPDRCPLSARMLCSA